MVTHSPSTSEVGSSNPGTRCGKVGSCLLMVGSLLYVLVSSAHKTTLRDITYTVLDATLKPK